MTTILEFSFKGESISLYMDTKTLFQDEVFSFYHNGYTYNFKVKWDRSEIEIFLTDETKPIYYVGCFELYFNKNLK